MIDISNSIPYGIFIHFLTIAIGYVGTQTEGSVFDVLPSVYYCMSGVNQPFTMTLPFSTVTLLMTALQLLMSSSLAKPT